MTEVLATLRGLVTVRVGSKGRGGTLTMALHLRSLDWLIRNLKVLECALLGFVQSGGTCLNCVNRSRIVWH